ncbi:MAG TPA: efflux RND transporter periplasmic adaptor subunit [Anaerolineae bacterium]|nr:efflux RND transporter periplasmic adaptor subunit [Anaerolineae bacterium]
MNRKRILFFLIAFVVLSVAGLVGYQRLSASTQGTPPTTSIAQAKEDVISAEGSVVPKSASDLAFRTGGRVIAVLVAEGDVVKQGQPLIRLQDDELKIGVAQAQAALDLAQANLAQIEQGARPEEIATAEGALRATQAQVGAAAADRDRLTGGATEAAIAAAQARLAATLVDQKLAQDAYDKVTECFTVPQKNGGKDQVCPGLGTPEEQLRAKLNAANEAVNAARKALAETATGSTKQVQAAQANVAAAVAQQDVAQARLDQVKSGATPAQIDAAKAGVAQAQAAFEAARAALNEATLKAPFAGTIAQINVDAGQVIGPGLAVASIADLQSWEVETDDLGEVDVVDVQPGQAVALTFDALPGVTLNGVVAAITPRAENKRGDVTYTVKINIEQPDPRLRWGMTTQVELKTK